MSKIKEAVIGFFLAVVLIASYLFGFGIGSARQKPQAAAAPSCDQSLWQHIYHAPRLKVLQQCIVLEATWAEASTRTGDHCRHEKDGDAHCWASLDEKDKHLLNDKNRSDQGGNLVVEPVCVYRTTQQDAKEACRNFHQQVSFPRLGERVRLTGSLVLDTQHGHIECHPCKIESLATT